MSKTKTSFSIKPETLEVLKQAAERDGRSLSNFLEVKIRELLPLVEADLKRRGEK